MTQIQHTVSYSWGHTMEGPQGPGGVVPALHPLLEKAAPSSSSAHPSSTESSGGTRALENIAVSHGHMDFHSKGGFQKQNSSTKTNFLPRMTQVWHIPAGKSWKHLGWKGSPGSEHNLCPISTLSPERNASPVPKAQVVQVCISKTRDTNGEGAQIPSQM